MNPLLSEVGQSALLRRRLGLLMERNEPDTAVTGHGTRNAGAQRRISAALTASLGNCEVQFDAAQTRDRQRLDAGCPPKGNLSAPVGSASSAYGTGIGSCICHGSLRCTAAVGRIGVRASQ